MLPKNIIISPPTWDAISAFGIGGIAVLIAILWAILFSKNRKEKTQLIFIATIILSISGIAAATGQLARFDFSPPPMLIMLVCVFGGSFWFAFSALGKSIAANISFATLIGIQVFRFPLELVMHHAGTKGIMPPELSYGGYNFDILTGIGALLILVLYLTKRDVPRWLLWSWNILGSFCLVVITFIALTTSPIIRLFGDSPEHINTWVLYFPYVWLPMVLVSIAISTHIIVWRKLLAQPTVE